ncbi:MAG TPA: HEAT repeat domain-containing protein [bacterium]|nr:HEAT repeat domain-containing protein [bacterium]
MPGSGACRRRRPGGRATRIGWVGALLALAWPAAADPLEAALERLRSPEVLVSDAAVDELVALGAPAVDALLPLLDDEGRDVRAGAIRGLGLLGDRRAAAPLRERLEASLAPGPPDDLTARYHRILLAQALGRLRDAEATPLLLRLAASGDPFERAHAAISLFLSDADPGYDRLRACLEDADPAIRCLAVRGAGESGREAALELMLPLAEDPSWLVRDAVFRALAPFATRPEAREAYRRGGSDPSWYVRRTVAEIVPE